MISHINNIYKKVKYKIFLPRWNTMVSGQVKQTTLKDWKQKSEGKKTLQAIYNIFWAYFPFKTILEVV